MPPSMVQLPMNIMSHYLDDIQGHPQLLRMCLEDGALHNVLKDDIVPCKGLRHVAHYNKFMTTVDKDQLKAPNHYQRVAIGPCGKDNYVAYYIYHRSKDENQVESNPSAKEKVVTGHTRL